MKPKYKTGDRVSYKGKVFRVVRTVMERAVLYDIEKAGREIRVAEKDLAKKERNGQEIPSTLLGD